MQACCVLIFAAAALLSGVSSENAGPSFGDYDNIMNVPDTLANAALFPSSEGAPMLRMAEQRVKTTEDASPEDPSGAEQAAEVEAEDAAPAPAADEAAAAPAPAPAADGEGDAEAAAAPAPAPAADGEGDAEAAAAPAPAPAAGGEGDAEAAAAPAPAPAPATDGEAAAAPAPATDGEAAAATAPAAAPSADGEGDAEAAPAAAPAADAADGDAVAASPDDPDFVPPGQEAEGPKPEDTDDHWRAAQREGVEAVAYTIDGKSVSLTPEEAKEAGEKAAAEEMEATLGLSAVQAARDEARRGGSAVVTGDVTSDSVTSALWDKNPMNEKALQIVLGQMLYKQGVLLEATGGPAGGIIIMGNHECKDSPLPLPTTDDAKAAAEAAGAAMAEADAAEAAMEGAKTEEEKEEAEADLAEALETEKLARVEADDAASDVGGPVADADAAEALVKQLERDVEAEKMGDMAEPSAPQSIERMSFKADTESFDADTAHDTFQSAFVKYYAGMAGVKEKQVTVTIDVAQAPTQLFGLATFADPDSKSGGDHMKTAASDEGLKKAGIRNLEIFLVAKALGGGDGKAEAAAADEGSASGSGDEESKDGAATGGAVAEDAEDDSILATDDAFKFMELQALLELQSDKEPSCRFPFTIILPKAAGEHAAGTAVEALLNPEQPIDELFVAELKHADPSAELLLMSDVLGFTVSSKMVPAPEEDETEEEAALEAGSTGAAEAASEAHKVEEGSVADKLAKAAEAAEEAKEMAVDAVGNSGLAPPKGYQIIKLSLSVKGVGLEKLVMRKWKIGAMVEAVFKQNEVNVKAFVDDVYSQEPDEKGVCHKAAESGVLQVKSEGDAAAFLQLQEERLLRRKQRTTPTLQAAGGAKKTCPSGVTVRVLLKIKDVAKSQIVASESSECDWYNRAKEYMLVTSEEAHDAKMDGSACSSGGSKDSSETEDIVITTAEVAPESAASSVVVSTWIMTAVCSLATFTLASSA